MPGRVTVAPTIRRTHLPVGREPPQGRLRPKPTGPDHPDRPSRNLSGFPPDRQRRPRDANRCVSGGPAVGP